MSDNRRYNKLAGHRILIFGGTSGIGYEVACASLESNASAIIISSSNPERVKSTIARLKGEYPNLSSKTSITGQACDIGNAETLEENVASILAFATEEGTKKLDHIVTTAGNFPPDIPFADMTPAHVEAAQTVRFTAGFMIAKHASVKNYFVPGPTSSFTLTSGSATERPIPGRGLVSGITSGLLGLSKGLALDLAPLRVNCIIPGAVDTEIWNFIPEEQRRPMLEGMAAQSTTGKIGTPEQIAEAYVYVMKDSNITGSTISTNGG